VIFAEDIFEHAKEISAARDHLDRMVKEGCSGTLLLRRCGEDGILSRSTREFAQLLGVCDHISDDGESTFAKVYNGLEAALLSNSQEICTFGSKLGLSTEHVPSPSPSSIFDRITHSLPSYDLHVVHLFGESCTIANELVGKIMGTFDPEKLFLILVGGHGDAVVPIHFSSRPRITPTQSYMMKNGQPVTDLKLTSPLYAVYHSRGITRRDETNTFVEEELVNNGGSGRMLAEHFMKEVAFKLGRMPKYGA